MPLNTVPMNFLFPTGIVLAIAIAGVAYRYVLNDVPMLILVPVGTTLAMGIARMAYRHFDVYGRMLMEFARYFWFPLFAAVLVWNYFLDVIGVAVGQKAAHYGLNENQIGNVVQALIDYQVGPPDRLIGSWIVVTAYLFACWYVSRRLNQDVNDAG